MIFNLDSEDFVRTKRVLSVKIYEIPVLISLFYEMVFMPILILFDIGFNMDFSSNLLVRFGYLILFSVGFIHFILTRSILNRYFIVSSFFLLSLGLCVSLFNDETIISNKLWSHIYFILMPFLVLPVGYHYGKYFQLSRNVQRKFYSILILSIITTVCVTLSFNVANNLGLSNYSAIGLVSILICGPFLYVHNHRGAFYFGVVLFIGALAAKSTILGASLVAGIVYFLVANSLRVKLLVIFFIFLFGITVVYVFNTFEVNHRFFNSLVHFYNGNYDAFSSKRWSELITLFSSFSSPWDWLFGMGYGYQFVPWANSPYYLSHYVHFGNFTWLLMNGVIGYLIMMGFFVYFLILNLKTIALSNDRLANVISVIVVSFLILSLAGAVLVTSSVIWFFIGWSLFNSQYYKA